MTARANVAIKTVTTQGRIHDGSSARERSFPNLNSDNFQAVEVRHDLAPDAGSWTQGEVDSLKAGVSSDNGNGANDQWAAMIFEMCAVSTDPPATGRRRAMGFVS